MPGQLTGQARFARATKINVSTMKFITKLLLVVAVAALVALAFVPTLFVPAATLCAALVCADLMPFSRRRHLVSAINVAEGTHNGSFTKKTDAAVATRYLLAKFGTDADHVAACGAGDIPLGSMPDEATAAEDLIAVDLLGIKKQTMLMVASEAITAGEAVFTAASGKVQDLPAGAGTYYQVGYALSAAAADGDPIEVQHHAPIKLVVT